MPKTKCGIVTPAAIVLALLISTNTANAAPFQAVMDEFVIIKDTAQLFRDSFTDGVLPPSGPDGASTYNVNGAGGFTTESGGKLTMTPSLGDPTILNSVTNTGVFATRALSINPANANFLGLTSSFTVSGLFDLATLPDIGDNFGIGLNDASAGSLGNDVVRVRLIRTNSGDIAVQLQDIDFVLGTATTTASQIITPFILGLASQIELDISKAANSNAVVGSFVVFNASHSVIQATTLAPATAPTIYDGEIFTRAQFFSIDRETVPEPASLALLGLGLAGLGWSRRKK